MTKKSYCRFCLAFCGIEVDFDSNNLPTNLRGDSTHPLSKGYTCKKGRTLLDFYSNNRLLSPLIHGKRCTWDYAIKSLGGVIDKVVSEYGPDAVALYAGTNAILDATAMWTALGFMYRLESNSIYTVNSIDGINKQIMIEQITSFSSIGLIPQVDFDGTDVLLIIGANPVVSHGHLAGMPFPRKRLRDIKKRGGKVIVADPRLTKTAKVASISIQPRPGTDYAWLGYVIRELLLDENNMEGIDWRYLTDHTHGIDELRQVVSYFDEIATARITGLSSESLHELVSVISASNKLSGITGTGVSFSDAGIVSEWFLWAVLAIKGSLDMPGGVWFNPGFTTNVSDLKPVIATDSAWNKRGLARPDLPARESESAVSGLADEIQAKNIKVLICVGGNPLTAFPDNKKTLMALNELEAFVVLDTHTNDLTNIADYALPVSGQLERIDSSIYTQNSSPVVAIQYTDRIVEAPDQVKQVFEVFSLLGEELGLDVTKLQKETKDISALDVLKTIKGAKELFTDSSELIDNGFVTKSEIPFGWVVNGVLPGKKWSLYSDILGAELARILEKANSNKGLLLVSMREDSHLNSQFMFNQLEPRKNLAFINSFSARLYDLVDGDHIELESEINSIRVLICVTEDVMDNTVCLSHGFANFGNVSNLTSSDDVNPLSGMVSQTALPIKIKKISF